MVDFRIILVKLKLRLKIILKADLESKEKRKWILKPEQKLVLELNLKT